jgi:hypothetical protein
MKTLTPSQKGAAAEAAITAAVIQLGLTVLRPLCEGRRYDLIVDLEPALLRVQCKLARQTGGVLSVRMQTSRHTPHGYVFTSYSPSEIDAVVAYSSELNRCFLLPIAEVAGMRGVHLRLEAPKNNQAQGIKWAADYELEPMIERLCSASTASGDQWLNCGCRFPGL